jgi:hypothetical protein
VVWRSPISTDTTGFRFRTLPPGNPVQRLCLSAPSCVGVVIYQGFCDDYPRRVLPDLGLFLICEPEFLSARLSTLNTITVNCRLYVRNLCDQTLLQHDRFELLIGHFSAHHVGLACLAQGGEPR